VPESGTAIAPRWRRRATARRVIGARPAARCWPRPSSACHGAGPMPSRRRRRCGPPACGAGCARWADLAHGDRCTGPEPV